LGPVGSKGEKESVLQAVASKLGVSAIANRFLALLVRKGRLELLSSLPSELVSIRVEAAGGVLGTVETAEELDGAAYEEISRAFSRKLGKSITLVPRVDADLLAGLRVTVQGVTYDGTLRGQLSRLGAELLFVNEADGVKA
jgi:ATP synthase F1 delta subunit